MADFVAVLKKTIDGLKDNSPQMREKVYDKARATIEAKLAALNPPPPPAVADRQRQSLEAAIVQVRNEYAAPPPAADPDFEQDFSNFFGEEQGEAPPSRGEPTDYADEPYHPVASRPADEIYDEPTAAADAGQADIAGYEDDYAERPYSDSYADDAQWQEDAQRDVFGDDAHTDRAALRADDYDADAAGGQPLYAPRVPVRKKRGASTGLIAALLVLIVVAGAGYGIWLNRDDFASMFGSAPQTVATEPTAAEPEEADVASAPADEAESDAAAEAPAAEAEKFTQRLLPDGTEVDEGVAGEEPTIGEGTSVAAVTPSGQAQGATSGPAAGEDQDQDQPQLAVGQRAIFYEERTANAEGSAESGTILWSLVQESPGGDLPPEAAIRAEVTIPARDLQLRMTIRRNGDQSLPASHIIEMIFLTSDDFSGGSIDNVLRVAMKDTEQAAGNPLIGIPAKIADGFFLVALSDSSAEVEANTTLLRRQSWIDIPITYGSGRRALMTMEKGIPGDRVFQEALRAWAALAPIAEENGDQPQ